MNVIPFPLPARPELAILLDRVQQGDAAALIEAVAAWHAGMHWTPRRGGDIGAARANALYDVAEAIALAPARCLDGLSAKITFADLALCQGADYPWERQLLQSIRSAFNALCPSAAAALRGLDA